jgi:uncharacterized protein (UPF0332 family)
MSVTQSFDVRLARRPTDAEAWSLLEQIRRVLSTRPLPTPLSDALSNDAPPLRAGGPLACRVALGEYVDSPQVPKAVGLTTKSATRMGFVASFAKDDVLLRVCKSKKTIIDLFSEGIYLEQSSNHSIEELRHRAAVDRLKLAEEFLGAGEVLMRSKPTQYRHAISRYYYSMYHAMRAVVYFTHGGDDHQGHNALPSRTPDDFIDNNIWQNNLKDARSRRNEADYDPYPAAKISWRRSARDLSLQASELIRLSRDYLRTKGCQYL